MNGLAERLAAVRGRIASACARAGRDPATVVLVAVTKGYTDYRASFLVNADAPLKSLADLRGKKLGAPEEDSITSWMVRATRR